MCSGARWLLCLQKNLLDTDDPEPAIISLRERTVRGFRDQHPAPVSVRLPSHEIPVRTRNQPSSPGVLLLPPFTEDATHIDPLWAVGDTEEEMATSRDFACSKVHNSYCIFLVIATRFKFFRLRVDQLPLRELPAFETAGRVLFQFVCNNPRKWRNPNDKTALLEIFQLLDGYFGAQTDTPKSLFVERFKSTFSSVRLISYTAAEGHICRSCLDRTESSSSKNAIPWVTGPTRRYNIAEYPDWVVTTKTARHVKRAAMTDLVDSLFEPHAPEGPSAKHPCSQQGCGEQKMDRVMIIRDRLPLLLVLGPSIIGRLSRASVAEFTDKIYIRHCHEKRQDGLITAEYSWLGAVYHVKDAFQLYQNSVIAKQMYRWTGDKAGAWTRVNESERPDKKHLVLLFYWQTEMRG